MKETSYAGKGLFAKCNLQKHEFVNYRGEGRKKKIEGKERVRAVKGGMDRRGKRSKRGDKKEKRGKRRRKKKEENTEKKL